MGGFNFTVKYQVWPDTSCALVRYQLSRIFSGNSTCCPSRQAKAGEKLNVDGISVDVINARFAKPIDKKIIELAAAGKKVITIEDHSVTGGFGSAVLEELNAHQKNGNEIKGKVYCLGGGDEFIAMASRKRQLQMIEVDCDSIVEMVKNI